MAKQAHRSSGGQRSSGSMGEIVRDGATDALESVTDAATQLRDRASERVAEWRDDVSEFEEERLHQMRGVKTALMQRLRDRPVAALLTAAGIGFVLGAIWRRR